MVTINQSFKHTINWMKFKKKNLKTAMLMIIVSWMTIFQNKNLLLYTAVRNQKICLKNKRVFTNSKLFYMGMMF